MKYILFILLFAATAFGLYMGFGNRGGEEEANYTVDSDAGSDIGVGPYSYSPDSGYAGGGFSVWYSDSTISIHGDTAAALRALGVQYLELHRPVVMINNEGDTAYYFPGDTIRFSVCRQNSYAFTSPIKP